MDFCDFVCCSILIWMETIYPEYCNRQFRFANMEQEEHSREKTIRKKLKPSRVSIFVKIIFDKLLIIIAGWSL